MQVNAAPLAVRPVSGRRERNAFIKLPFRLYRDNPVWVPPLIISERALIDPAKNPFFEHAEMQLFIAWEGGTPVGRIAAIDDQRHNATWSDNLAFFGFFEAETEAIARALLHTAESWARARGREVLRGPVNPSLNDSAGLLIDAFDRRPLVMMPYNPPSYPEYLEAIGYAKAKDLYAWWFDIRNSVNERAQRIIERITRRLDPVPTIRAISKKHFERDIAIIHEIFTTVWKDNWGFVAPTEAEFRHAAKEMKPILEWGLIHIMESAGEPIAFSLTLPDMNRVLAQMNGRLLPFGILKLLRRRRTIDRNRLVLLGVLEEHRQKGLELMLIAAGIRETERLGWIGGECSWTLEDNHGINKGIQLVGGKRYKTYRIYDKRL